MGPSGSGKTTLLSILGLVLTPTEGEVLVGGCRARVLGRVSMDLTAIDVTGIRCRIGDTVTVIGRSDSQELRAPEIAQIAGTTHYEFLTRLNPLIEKIVA